MRFPFFRTIRTQLLILVFISILPALGIIIYSGINRSYHEIENAKSDALGIVKSFAYDIERCVESTRQFLVTLAKIPDIQNLNVPAGNRLLVELLKQNPLYITLFVVNAQGILTSSGTLLPTTPLSLETRKYFQDAVRTKAFSVGEYEICVAVKKPVLVFSYPIVNAREQFKGIISVSINFGRYAQMFPIEQLPHGSTLSLSDHKGTLLYRYPGEEDNIPKPEFPDVIKQMSAKTEEGVFTYTGEDYIKRLNAYKRFHLKAGEPPYLYMRVGIPEEKALLHAREALLVNLVLLGIAFVIAVIVAWFLGNFIIVKRLNQLVEASRRLGQGDLKTRTGLNYKHGELGELGKVFDEMAEALERKNTERQQAEEELRESEKKYRSLFESANDAIYLIDPHTQKIIDCNKKAAEMDGYSIDELKKMTAMNLHPIDEHNILQQKSKDVLVKGSISGLSGIHHLRKDNRLVPIEVNATMFEIGGERFNLSVVRDITDRKLAEEALRESENKFRDLAEKSMVGIFILQDGVFKYFNKRLVEIQGYTLEELIDKKGPKDLILPEDWPMVEENIRKRLSGEVESTHYEVRGLTKNNRIINLEVYSSRTMYQGRPALIGTLVDITDRKCSEEALHNERQRFQALTDNAPFGMVLIDSEGRFTYINPRFKELFGYDLTEIPNGRTWFRKAFPDPDRRYGVISYWLNDFGEARIGEKRQRDSTVICKDGTKKVISFVSAWLDAGEILVSCEDITDRKRAEEALQESEAKYRSIVENSLVGVYIIQDNLFRFVNRKWCEMHGYTYEEVVNKLGPVALAHPEDQKTVEKNLRDRLSGKVNYTEYEIRHVRKDSKVMLAKVLGSLIVYDRRPAILGTVIDITNERTLESQLRQAQKMEAIGTLAGGIAHDFNNLLMTILGYTSLILMNTDPHHPNYEKLKIIERQVQSGADLTSRLLGFARGGKYETKTTDLNELLTKSSDMFGRTKKEISLYRRFEKNLWTVEVDRGQVEQVFLNLFVNAWQAMPGGGELYLDTQNIILDEIQCSLYSLKPGKYVKVSITDTGVGMDEATKQRAFDPFFTTKGMGRGTGLGLASTYGIIKNHGGTINLYSEKGKGTTFTIYLPASEKVPIEEKMILGEVLGGTETILFIDDQDIIIKVGKEMLNALGYKVLLAKSGKEALEVFEKNKEKIDLVILDMIMPVMSGGEVYNMLKNISPHIKVILSSGYSMEGQAAEILKLGCNGFIQKPFNMGDLSKKIREVLD